MKKTNQITKEILKSISDYAYERHLLDDVLELLNIPKSLEKDEQILRAFTRGQIKHYINISSGGFSDEQIVKYSPITKEKCEAWSIKYKNKILDKKMHNTKVKTQEITNVLSNGVTNIVEQRGDKKNKNVSTEVMEDAVKAMVEKMQNGDTSDMLNILVTNTLQLQELNNTVTKNITGTSGEKIEGFEVLSKIQLKAMAETRKNMMAINEICNPRRTTFIKQANQYNQLSQENSQKKLNSKNELQKTKELSAPEETVEAEMKLIKECIK